jgi:hypothetical protein
MATHELLRVLLANLSTDFATNFEGPTLEEPAGEQGTMENQKDKILLIGASHCKRLFKVLCERGFECIDLTVPGWTPSVQNVEQIVKKLAEMDLAKGYTTVMDILSNTTFRFEQYDGTLSLPFKANGGHHMGGIVRVCGRDVLINTIMSTKDIFGKLPGAKVVLPPLPRYVFGPCCDDEGHCMGSGTPEHISEILESTTGLRKHIQDGLIRAGVTNFVVPDLIQKMVDEKGDYKQMGEKLKLLTSHDNVHLTMEGYNTVADVVVKTLSDQKSAALLSNSGSTGPRAGFYWRGFVSPVGTTRVKYGATTYKQARVGGGKWRGGGHHWNSPPFGAGRGRGGRRGRY